MRVGALVAPCMIPVGLTDVDLYTSDEWASMTLRPVDHKHELLHVPHILNGGPLDFLQAVAFEI